MLVRALRRLGVLSMCLLAISMAACATSGAVPRPFPSPDWDAAGTPAPDPTSSAAAPDNASAVAPSSASVDEPVDEAGDERVDSGMAGALTARRFDGRAIAEFAMGFRGVPYRLGGADPAGFDCSGLVQYVFAQYGIGVPRVVEQQFEVGDKIKPSDIKPGDLIFFNTKGPGPSHVAISIGQERFVHAPNSTGVVRVETLTSTYWGSRYMGARRVNRSTSTN
jgi:cell wall-associated NlpC family hydrolase